MLNRIEDTLDVFLKKIFIVWICVGVFLFILSVIINNETLGMIAFYLMIGLLVSALFSLLVAIILTFYYIMQIIIRKAKKMKNEQ